MSKHKGSDDSKNDPQPPPNCIHNRPGFQVAHTRDPPTQQATITSSMSGITTLALGASGDRLKAKHRERSHTPAAPLPPTPTPASLLQTSFPDNISLHTEDNPAATDTAKPKRKHNNNAQRYCVECEQEDSFFKCKDCLGGCQLRCQACLFFEKDYLGNLGLRIQLGHRGHPCPCPMPGPPSFMVFNTSGVHSVNANYCDCPNDDGPDRRTQLLRLGRFPATFTRPNTAFMFDCLDTFHEHMLQGKGNLYDFYDVLLRKTDNANVSDSIYRYKEIHRVFQIWRNLMVLKPAGQGHDPEGIEATSPGSLTVECPACPHPGRNLPDDWQKAVNVNFKLKSKEHGLKDVELMPGWGPYVEESGYQNFIANYVDQPEINTCESEHDAIVRAQTRCTPGYAIFIMYDIGCQWSKNYQSRMADFPEHMRIKSGMKVDVLIPSWHINGHGERCKKRFCLWYTKGIGRTCREEVEISWSHTNPLVPSVREMAPVAWHDTLNDHWNGWNFHKIVGFRTLFAKRFQEAVLMSKKQTEVSDKFSEMFPSKVVNKWIKMVENWEGNPKAVNLYNEPEKTFPRFVFKNKLSRSKGKKTSKQLANLKEKRSSLIHKIQLWQPVQLAYVLHIATLLPFVHDVDEYTNQYANLESTPLFLPSSLPPSILTLSDKLKEMCEAECRLRELQADDALSKIHCLRRIITGLWLFKKINVSGTGNRPNTRMLNMYNRLHSKLQCAAHCYRTAYNALLALDPTRSWKEHLRKLDPADIRGSGRDPDDVEDTKRSKGRFEPSWIWLVPCSPCERGDDQTEEEFNDTIVLSYFEWRAKWWLEQDNRRQIEDMSVLSRVSAYTHKQASICDRMAARCAGYWLQIMKKHNVVPGVRNTVETTSKSDNDDDDDDELDKHEDSLDLGDLDVEDLVDFD
ncbi:hypothetical protein K443DRAFT_134179 [Laccaria amethystina LaAM-08-1]|uniref:CxC2-like cysteine cluster KDZ transposase-associated domain-containing protein n=1 Tax=Laccaria amethystina LaAM-08-1 TaxID=1095629 RepID=A0A0C9WKC7_9AGAR|nr:hypothetical protein K443DRAFT_134179 [Laccaria amethystina LaAM-08-1]